MCEILTVVRLRSLGLLLWVALLGNLAQAGTMVLGADTGKTSQYQRTGGQDNPKESSIRKQVVHIIQGDVLRVEGDTYFIKELGGKEVSLHADSSTMKAERIQVGDRIEAKIDENNRALSLLLAP